MRAITSGRGGVAKTEESLFPGLTLLKTRLTTAASALPLAEIAWSAPAAKHFAGLRRSLSSGARV